MLAGEVPLREPWPSELDFFRNHRDVAGLAADDNCVVINPYSGRSEQENKAVMLNEAARVVMRRESLIPRFDLTDEQLEVFGSYGPIDSIRETIAARILSRDPSALVPTEDQLKFARQLAERMGVI
jgi:hypothetical protein